MQKNPNFLLKILVRRSLSRVAFFRSRDSIDLFIFTIEIGVKGNVLAKQLFLDLIRANQSKLYVDMNGTLALIL